MTRIIAGYAGSLTIAVPSAGTRPTSDRLREAIFSALEARDAIEGSRVLDLYAGTGALGLESASRGAPHVTLVESNARAADACRKNATLIAAKAPRGSKPIILTAARAVRTFLETSGDQWDLVFIDPPYELGNDELVAALELLATQLSPDALVVVERSSRDPEPEWPVGLELDRGKDYGDTALYWLQPTAPSQPA
ncbi:MAG: 16S rRNA (guanine(966)-N(2))-methyltransferase RsmD [Rhodoglobus sp.]